ncbi:class III lanthionine synthetase LanKC [Streptomyces sp. LaBMicrA B280]|uniref:class III lanthionine synthetase LanKC n=1 Tax=Streptomyces sp. LaBMicrA B280 TaxID=3391001 RepID=UPI003BA59576
MAVLDFWLTLADPEFYVPLERALQVGERYRPAQVPDGWRSAADGVWQHWQPAAPVIAQQGWKVHVSTTLDRLQFTLDTVARICFEEQVAFKHLANQLFFETVHHKHAARSQAGKFCALYPPDTDTARRLLDRLARELKDEVGPYVLSDRRYGDTGVVYYRYGAFLNRTVVQLDGTRVHVLRDGRGEDVPDIRSAQFVLPAGIEDPFSAPPAPHTGPILLNDRFEITKVIRHSNGGGTYRATDTLDGRTVFVKEARAHNGLIGDGTDSRDRLRREHAMLRLVHERSPGLCPEPIDHFTEWEHDFLVTEFVEGTGFLHWVAGNTVMGRLGVDADRHASYLADVERLMTALRERIDRLHAIGLRFGDLSHGNVVVQDDLTVRLIDFETATLLTEEPSLLGTPGYTPPRALREAGVDRDEYGLSGLALCALFPLSQPLERDPRGRAELYLRDLEQEVPVPDTLWDTATRYHGRAAPDTGGRYELPTAADLDKDPEGALAALRAGLTDGLIAMARPDGADWLFPPSPRGYATNTHCLEHGSAGVLHALHQAGAPVPEEISARFRRDALANADDLAPGLQAGTAGLAWVLAELGHLEEAGRLLAASLQHPLALSSAHLGNGASGIGLTHLYFHAHHGGEERLLTAVKLGDTFTGRHQDAVLADAGTPGLASGLAGTALFLTALGEHTGEQRYLKGAVRLLHAELDRAVDGGPDGLLFRDDSGIRNLPYLAAGSAGVALALGRLAALSGDERLSATLPRVLTMCRLTCAAEPGLYLGVAGWAYCLAEHAHHTGDPGEHTTAVRIATGLAKYTIRHPSGLRVLAGGQERFTADLASGSAGVLLALARVLDGPGVRLLPTPAAP